MGGYGQRRAHIKFRYDAMETGGFRPVLTGPLSVVGFWRPVPIAQWGWGGANLQTKKGASKLQRAGGRGAGWGDLKSPVAKRAGFSDILDLAIRAPAAVYRVKTGEPAGAFGSILGLAAELAALPALYFRV